MKSGSKSLSRFNRLLVTLAVMSFAAIFPACSGQSAGKTAPPAAPGSIVLQGAGATFPSPLYKKWFAAYQQSHPTTIITYESVGSGEGARRFIGRNVRDEERVDFGASDAALQDGDIAEATDGALMIPVTAGAVVLAYNLPGLPQELRLTRRAYAGIFLGEITNWNDPLIAAANPGVKLPRLTIVTAVRQDASGTTFAFTKHLDAISEKWRREHGPSTLVNWPEDAMRAKGNEGVAGVLSHSVGAVGYVGYEFAQRYGLQIALMENKAGRFVTPSEASLQAALDSAQMPENLRVYLPDPSGPDAYPITSFSWILLHKTYGDHAKAQALRDVFSWALSGGQQYASDLGYVPLTPGVVEKAEAAVQSIRP